jgi:hypothetical protein
MTAPERLRARVGKREIKFSLEMSDAGEAKIRQATEQARWRSYFSKLGRQDMRRLALIACAFAMATPASAQTQTWSPQPWLDDLAQAREAFMKKYANIRWLEQDRETSLNLLFRDAAERLRSSSSADDAKAAFEQLLGRIGDGHVSITWRRLPPVAGASVNPGPGSSDVCDGAGFDPGRNPPGIVSHLRGYRPLEGDRSFSAGIIHFRGRTVGVIRIGGFEPLGMPWICREAVQALEIPPNKPCEGPCRVRLLGWSYDRLTAALEAQVQALKSAGATVLLVDITNNGGGTEWAHAAARILSSRQLTSERRGFVRGPHWSAQWGRLAEQLRSAARTADWKDRIRLQSWAAEAEAARREADDPCAGTGKCGLVAAAGFATGLVGSARAGEFARKPWGTLVFSIAVYPYHDGVWSGPLLVLVDDETWSAAEAFAATLQDNKAAVIVGTRTGGGGCGHTNGGTPTILKNSGATLELPDCASFRTDGSNEAAGIIPDVLVGMRARDGMTFKAKLTEAVLGRAVDEALRLRFRRRQ